MPHIDRNRLAYSMLAPHFGVVLGLGYFVIKATFNGGNNNSVNNTGASASDSVDDMFRCCLVGGVVGLLATIAVRVADLYLRRSISDEGQGSRGLDEEKYLEKQVKEVYDAIEKDMNNDELNDEGKKAAIKNILFNRFACQGNSRHIVNSQEQLYYLRSLEAGPVNLYQKIHKFCCCIKRSKPEFKNPEILQLMQDYFEAVVGAEDYTKLVDEFVENRRRQTGEGLGRRGGSGPSTSVSEARVDAGGERALLLEGL